MALPKRRVDMVVGSPEWARETVAWAKTRWQHRQVTEEHWREALDELRAGRAWEPLGKRDLDDLLKAEIGVDVEGSLSELREREHGVRGGKPGPGRGHKTSDVISRFSYGTNRAYILARLRRDGQDALADAVERGDLSAHRAAIQVGYRKEKTALQQLAHWWQKATEDEQQQFLDYLTSQRRMTA